MEVKTSGAKFTTQRHMSQTRSPRIPASPAAERVIRGATDLLVEGGPWAVTVDAVVARSGVAKSTIYRHWESRDELLVEILASCAPDIGPPPPELSAQPTRCVTFSIGSSRCCVTPTAAARYRCC